MTTLFGGRARISHHPSLAARSRSQQVQSCRAHLTNSPTTVCCRTSDHLPSWPTYLVADISYPLFTWRLVQPHVHTVGIQPNFCSCSQSSLKIRYSKYLIFRVDSTTWKRLDPADYALTANYHQLICGDLPSVEDKYNGNATVLRDDDEYPTGRVD